MSAATSPDRRTPRLRVVTDNTPGIRRERRGHKFAYVDAGGRPLRTRGTLKRIASLAIPPAWTDVWICPRPDGHIQATGRDARGRKQYRYHPAWSVRRESAKTRRLMQLADALPAIRRRVRRDLGRAGLPREKVLALMVRLLELTAIRPGHREYARDNGSYGLASMQDGHATIKPRHVEFRFPGKGGKRHLLTVRDPIVKRMVARCRELRGSALFQYEAADGQSRAVHAGDLNAYLKEISGAGVTAKDLRTWTATVLAFTILRRCGPAGTAVEAKRNIQTAICSVAEHLGNTPVICRKSYIHGAVIRQYLDGAPLRTAHRAARGLSGTETAVRALLNSRAR
jgi:DNA topoisomerase-1